ncbi:MAG: NHL repeat-containing protein [Pseudomonadota bacterium]
MMKAMRVIFLCLVLFMVPLSSRARDASFSVVATLTSNKEIGLIGVIGGLFFDESRQRLYVCDSSNGRILAYDSEFNYLSALKPGGDLKYPASIVKSQENIFFVIDPTIRGVLAVDVTQKLVRKVQLAGIPKADTFHPGNMTIDSYGNIYIIDKANSGILLFDSNLMFQREILRVEHGNIDDVKIDPQGNIYTISTIEGIVRKYTSSGDKVLEFGKRGDGKDEFHFPVSLAVDSQGTIYVLDKHKGKVLLFDETGRFMLDFSKFGWKEGELAYPSFIAVNNAHLIFIADQDNARVSVFKLVGM